MPFVDAYWVVLKNVHPFICTGTFTYTNTRARVRVHLNICDRNQCIEHVPLESSWRIKPVKEEVERIKKRIHRNYDSPFIFHVHINRCSSRFMISLWASYYPDAQIEVNDQFRQLAQECLTERSKLQNRRTICWSRDLLGVAGQLLNPCTFRLGPDKMGWLSHTISRRCLRSRDRILSMPPVISLVSEFNHLSQAEYGGSANLVEGTGHSSLSWHFCGNTSVTRRYDIELHQQRLIDNHDESEAFQQSFRTSNQLGAWDTHTWPGWDIWTQVHSYKYEILSFIQGQKCASAESNDYLLDLIVLTDHRTYTPQSILRYRSVWTNDLQAATMIVYLDSDWSLENTSQFFQSRSSVRWKVAWYYSTDRISWTG